MTCDGHLAQVHLHLLLQMRIAAQERRQELPGGGDIDLADALLEGERHERARRPFRQAIEAVLHADELQLGPRMIGLRREEKTRVLQRLAQAGGGDDFKIEIEPRAAAAASAARRRRDAAAARCAR